jgi:hypothetical protein
MVVLADEATDGLAAMLYTGIGMYGLRIRNFSVKIVGALPPLM